MPYIDGEARRRNADGFVARTAGELNYAFTRSAVRYIETQGLSYQTLNDVIGALEGAKAEFLRRVVTPYEDAKIIENGDVYPASMAKAIEPVCPLGDGRCNCGGIDACGDDAHERAKRSHGGGVRAGFVLCGDCPRESLCRAVDYCKRCM